LGVTVVALAAIAALLPAGSASAARARTTVTIGSEHSGFSGTVSSRRAACANNRKVWIYKQGRRPLLVGTATATQDGAIFRWTRRVPNGSGQYYATVKATRSCGAAKSGTTGWKPLRLGGSTADAGL
jgi:hypothetical protein